MNAKTRAAQLKVLRVFKAEEARLSEIALEIRSQRGELREEIQLLSRALGEPVPDYSEETPL